jgi:ATP-binding cassette, subfamily B, multidrug efflux pump
MATVRRAASKRHAPGGLSTIRDADLILVMESGRIIEQGTHDEVLGVGGVYARMCSAQFASVMAAVK